jgi:LysR family glycine cleavage system transcriptional activator
MSRKPAAAAAPGRKLQRRPKAASRGIPLNAVRIFSVCAQHLSFTRAAQTLMVTQAAVSHQIAALEDYLEVRLFRRSGRGVVLTEEGTTYLGAVREALAHLEQATTKVRAKGATPTLVCSIATTIAMRWLVPNLRGFNLLYPALEVRLSLTERFVDFERENVDVAVRYGEGHWPGLICDLLYPEVLVPVCSPELLRGPPQLLAPTDLKRHTLLHASASRRDWHCWLSACHIRDVDARGGLVFEQPHLALQAAADGLGVAMADRWLVQSDLATGRLVMPFEGGLTHSKGYYIVGRPSSRDSLHVGPFWQWLLAQAAERRDSLG